MSILESSVERRCAAYATKHGCVLLKLIKRTHWPDRLCVLPNGQSFYVEFKRPGGEMSPGQRHIQELLNSMGHACFEVDNRHLFERLLQERLML